MPRNYQKKNTKVKWTQEDMDRALRDVREHSMSVHVASKKYNIPDQTLRDRIHGKVKDEAKVGRPTFFVT